MSEETSKRYWQAIEDLEAPASERTDEFAEPLPVGPDAAEGQKYHRRGFFQIMGLSAAAASAASCSRSPVGKIIPYLDKPEEVTPGVALWYASSCAGCSAGCGILLKSRDGRPIKVEGNDEHPWTRGGACAVGHASLLSLYDASRTRGPASAGSPVSWTKLDDDVVAGLKQVSAAGRKIRVVASSFTGPTLDAAIAKFAGTYPTAGRVRYDAIDYEAIAEAHETSHGKLAIPVYRFDRARVIVGLGADFLGTWLSPVAFARQYADGRNVGETRKMSRHIQLEPKMSLTGSNADTRFVIAPSDVIPILIALLRKLEAPSARAVASEGAPELASSKVDAIAAELAKAKGEALVVCGSTDRTAQLLTNALNAALDAYGNTIDLDSAVARSHPAASFEEFLGELSSGEVGAVLFLAENPVYAHAQGKKLAELIAKVDVSVTTSDRRDETGAAVKYLAPDHHFLESWGDVALSNVVMGVRQPAVLPLFDTRSACESLLRWSEAPATHYDFMRARWEREVFPQRKDAGERFASFWERCIQAGFAELRGASAAEPALRVDALRAALARIPAGRPRGRAIELVLYEKVGMRDGKLANNGWLQELPDPISKVTWTNYACISPALATELGVAEGNLVSVKDERASITLPALVEPGVHPRTVAIAVGYGRTHAGPIARERGVNAFPLAVSRFVEVSLAGGSKSLAKSQTHPSMEGRPIVKEATLVEYLANPSAGNEVEHKRHLTMWSGHAYPGHRWGMVVDLNACIGCSACIVSCNAENNVAIVGEDEVLRRREMHWMRIDRYFAGSPEEPEVVHQPVMCQHCENAPCETVCPVLATVHSSEGLNQQVYNRCVGTRYCANNCPPKVRRFNWFDYPHDDPVERMVLNPDVVVRSRGVMEKCSLCVQRIQEGKAVAKREGRAVRDGEIRLACQQSCPAQAIEFGDLNDPNSRVSARVRDARNYAVLEELNVKPAVTYLTRIRNKPPEEGHG